jgi:mRNA-degrading endonuclease RelE of RelBE toxin-antitoxin system
VARKQVFLPAEWSDRWKESYAGLSSERQKTCDSAALALIKQETSSGLRVKPIHPDKYYWEARLNSGDRIIYRIEAGTIFFIDVVKHDDIYRYARRPKTP